MSHVLASFFDIGNDGFDAQDAVVVTVLVTASMAGLRWLWRRWRQGKSWSEAKLKEALRPVIHEVVTEVMADALKHVDKRTEPIQPGANSGDSLPDNNRMTEWIIEGLLAVAKKVGVTLADLPPRPVTRHPRTDP